MDLFFPEIMLGIRSLRCLAVEKIQRVDQGSPGHLPRLSSFSRMVTSAVLTQRGVSPVARQRPIPSFVPGEWKRCPQGKSSSSGGFAIAVQHLQVRSRSTGLACCWDLILASSQAAVPYFFCTTHPLTNHSPSQGDTGRPRCLIEDLSCLRESSLKASSCFIYMYFYGVLKLKL